MAIKTTKKQKHLKIKKKDYRTDNRRVKHNSIRFQWLRE